MAPRTRIVCGCCAQEDETADVTPTAASKTPVKTRKVKLLMS